MSNKIKLAVPTILALGLMLSGTVAFAEGTTSTTANTYTTGTDINTTTVNTAPTRKSCLVDAKTARVATVKAASDVAKSARTDAKNTRDSALKYAKDNTDKKAMAKAVKAANTAYKMSLKDVAKTVATSTKAAWSIYAVAVKACPKK